MGDPHAPPAPEDAAAQAPSDSPEVEPRSETREALPDAPSPEPSGSAEVGAEPAVDYHDRWLRAEAELQNFRRRAQRDREESMRAAEESVLRELIHVLDDLERAIEAARQAAAPESWTEGVKLVVQRALEYLGRQGVQIVDPVGEDFDPAFHEALLELPAGEGVRPGQVTQVIQKGYRRGPRPLRAARVVVASEASPPSEES